MFVAGTHSPVLATLGGSEVFWVLTALFILFEAKSFPDIMRGLGNGMSKFRKALDQQAEDAGKSTGGVFGKPAAEALTPDNQTAELYDPAVFHRHRGKRSIRRLLRDLWFSLL